MQNGNRSQPSSGPFRNQSLSLDMPAEPDVNPASDLSERVYEPSTVVRDEHAEASVTRLVEQQTAKSPSHVFLFAAFTSMGVSLFLELTGRHRPSRFIGMWAPSLLIMGVYNKLVKRFGPR